MTKTKFLTIMLFLTGMILINSCGEDNADDNPITPPDVSETFFKATVGDTWTYEGYDIPNATGEIDTDSRYEYTVTVTGQEKVLNEDSYIYKYEGDGADHSKHFIPDGKVLKGLVSDVMPAELPFDLPIEDAWVTIADLTKNEWQVYTMDFVDLPVSFGSINALISGKLTIMGELKEESTFSIENTDYKARKIDIKFHITGTGTINGFPIPGGVDAEMLGHFYYGEGSGLLKIEYPSQNIALSAASYPLDGYIENCIKLNVK